MAAVPLAAWVAWPAAASTSVGAAEPVPGTFVLARVACPSATTCVAVGSNSFHRSLVLAITDGIPGPVHVVAQSIDLFDVACPDATTCEAVGQDSTSFLGVVMPIVNGLPAAPQELPGTSNLAGVACPSATTCVAVGQDSGGNGGRNAVVVAIGNGNPGVPQVVAGATGLSAIACPVVGMCQAVGNVVSAAFPGFNEGVVVPVTNGNPGAARLVPGTLVLEGIGCSAVTTCEAVGSVLDMSVGSPFNDGVVVPVINGTPGALHVVMGTFRFFRVACPSVVTCVAVGYSTSFEGVVLPLTNGLPGAVEAAPGSYQLLGVACPTSTICEAVGLNPESVPQGVLATITTTNPFTVTVSGSQTLGSSNPTFRATSSPPPGDTFTGTLICTAVGNPAMAISPAMPAGSYTLDGSGCAGLTLIGPTASAYQIVFRGGTFTVLPAPPRSTTTTGPTLPVTGGAAATPLVEAAALIVVGLAACHLRRRARQ